MQVASWRTFRRQKGKLSRIQHLYQGLVNFLEILAAKKTYEIVVYYHGIWGVTKTGTRCKDDKKWSKFQLKIFDLFFRNSFFLLAIKIGFLNEDMEDQNMCHTIHSIQYGPYYYSIVSAAFLGFSSSFRCFHDFFDMTR